MPECRARFFLLWINRSPSDQFFVLLSHIQATSMSRTSWLDLSTGPWLQEYHGFPCASFIPGHISVKFCIILFANSRPFSLCSMNGAPNIKRWPLSDRPLPRRFCSSGDEELWTSSNVFHSSKWIGNILLVQTAYQSSLPGTENSSNVKGLDVQLIHFSVSFPSTDTAHKVPNKSLSLVE